METEYKVAEDVAIADVKAFVEYHLEKNVPEEKVTDDYPDIIEAVKLGLLVFGEDQTPTLTLKRPVKNAEGGIALGSVVFKTRLLVSDQERMAKGVDYALDRLKLINRFRAFFISQPVAMLDKLGKFDFKVIDQLSTVFM